MRDIIEAEAETHGKPLKDLTVLSASRDPYRLDTPANHVLGKWLQAAYANVNPNDNVTHLRGLHYMLVGRVNKPDGKRYTNTDENWEWLSEKVAKAARWLGYLDWDLIRDARNTSPNVFTPKLEKPEWRIEVADVALYLPDDLEPRFTITGDLGRQPYRQVVIAEKQGVENVLLGVCETYSASLVLPSGEISDSLVYGIMKAAHEDGRPLAIHQLGDFDPAGNQMAVSTARTVQAMRDRLFPDMRVIVNAIGLTLEQCEAWELPSTPLKETEKRADKWVKLMGREQTELDAAVALNPKGFACMVAAVMDEYYDHTLTQKTKETRQTMIDAANESVTEYFDDERQAVIRGQVEARLWELQAEVEAINESLNVDLDGIRAPSDLEPLMGEVTENMKPLLDTGQPWIRSTLRMIKRKALAADDK